MDENFEQNTEQNAGQNQGQEENETRAEKLPVKFKPKKDLKKLIKDILYYGCILALICIIIYMYIGSRPVKRDDVACVYKEKQDKIVCVQTGDIVPDWLDLNQNMLKGIFGSDTYSMYLIFSKDNKDYIAMKMVDNVFVSGMNRKFIYETAEQSLSDYIRFKNYAVTGEISNWGSSILYCSDKNLSKNDICSDIKRNHRK